MKTLFAFLLLLCSSLSRANVDVSCQVDSDCVIVQHGWCKDLGTVRASYLKTWLRDDKVTTEELRKQKRECEPGSEGNPKGYRAVCRKKTCELQRQ